MAKVDPPGRACNAPLIPLPIDINGLTFFTRFEVENWKRQLLGKPPLVGEPDKIELLTVRRLAFELDVHPRTIKRRVEEARAAAAEVAAATALETVGG